MDNIKQIQQTKKPPPVETLPLPEISEQLWNYYHELVNPSFNHNAKRYYFKLLGMCVKKQKTIKADWLKNHDYKDAYNLLLYNVADFNKVSDSIKRGEKRFTL